MLEDYKEGDGDLDKSRAKFLKERPALHSGGNSRGFIICFMDGKAHIVTQQIKGTQVHETIIQL